MFLFPNKTSQIYIIYMLLIFLNIVSTFSWVDSPSLNMGKKKNLHWLSLTMEKGLI